MTTWQITSVSIVYNNGIIISLSGPGIARVLFMGEKTYSYIQGGDTPFGMFCISPVSPSPRNPVGKLNGLKRTGIS